MRSIAELQINKAQRGVGLLASGATVIATSGVTDLQPTKWAIKVVQFAEELRQLDQLIYVNKEAVGTKDEKITVPTSTGHLDITTAHTEGAARTTTTLDNMGKTDFSFVAGDFLQGVITISKRLLMTCAVDLITQAKYVIAEDLADDVDLAIATQLQSTSLTTNIVYGGDATQCEDLVDGDVMTTDLIADARRLIKVNAKCVPKYIVISSYQEATLMKDSQFVNASEYGSNEVVLKGEIGNYLGLKVIVTDNANLFGAAGETDANETPATYSASATGGVNVCPVVGEKRSGERVSVGLAWKEMPAVGYEFEKDETIHKLYYDQAFTTNNIFTEAWALIKVSQT
ncbi:hypothetical protein LCGC14_1192030 [marine sediment metagenome]|uniref:N4-gp56 family major capsid protein n=1 Tax=marine sediment metagenome TaxID=412755 RepID=A0A0F9LNW5_9ZZZZ